MRAHYKLSVEIMKFTNALGMLRDWVLVFREKEKGHIVAKRAVRVCEN